MSAPLTVGTAGHVDHGKSSLVRALTGIDPDRLPEEHARGLSIELGYAALALPSGARLSVVDVPGHERFVRTMVSGATGIDLFLMVVAADDGVMPQTREHAAVLAALDVRAGVIAVTKSDLLDPGPAIHEATELMPGTPIVACAAPSGRGLHELRERIDEVSAQLPGRATTPGPVVLHVDRAFTLRGAGTVVTGTLWQGTVRPGDRLRLLPSGRAVRARSVHVHDQPVDAADAGQRVAVNLAGLGVDEVDRGDALVGEDAPPVATTVLDARLALRSDAAHNQRVQLHHGTRAATGRIADLGDGFWQLRLQAPVLAAAGDRVVVRSVSPPDTLGGGVVLDASARRHGRAQAHRERLARAAPQPSPPPEPSAPEPSPLAGPSPSPAVPTDPRVPDSAPALGPDALRLAERLRAAGHEPPSEAELGADAAALPALREAGLALRVGRDRYAHPDAIAGVRERLEAIVARDGGVTLAGLRDDLHTSRKFAQALLEHFDATKVTVRLPDDRRVLRRRSRTVL